MLLSFGRVMRSLARVGGGFLSLALARRRAVRGFRSGLRETGLPEEVISELVRNFPRLRLNTRLGRSRMGG